VLALTVLPLVAQTAQTAVDETVEVQLVGLWVASQPAVLRVSLFCGSRQKALTIPLGTAD